MTLFPARQSHASKAHFLKPPVSQRIHEVEYVKGGFQK